MGIILLLSIVSALSVDSLESALGAEFFLDISNKKMYNINRVGENVTFIMKPKVEGRIQITQYKLQDYFKSFFTQLA